MKNQIKLLAFLTLLVVTFGACEKEDSNKLEQGKSNSILLLEAKDLTTEYYINQSENQAARGGKWWRIIRNDMIGAAGGAMIGAGVSAGNPVGALIGGVIGGAGASIATAVNLSPPGNQFGNLEQAHATINVNNEYDIVGSIHYQLVDHVIKNKSEYYTSAIEGDNLGEAVFNYNKYYEKANELISQNGIHLEMPNILNESENMHNEVLAYEDTIVSYVTNQNNLEGLTDTEREILKVYYSGVINFGHTDTFTEYSTNFENLVSENDGLSENSKAILLVNMATARYGIAYWKDLI